MAEFREHGKGAIHCDYRSIFLHHNAHELLVLLHIPEVVDFDLLIADSWACDNITNLGP